MTSPALIRAAELLSESGLEAWEAFLLDKRSARVEVKNRREVLTHRVVESGIGLRGYAEGRSGFASTTRLDADGLRECIGKLWHSLCSSAPEEPMALPPPNPSPVPFEAFCPSAEKELRDWGTCLARRAEAAACSRAGVCVSACQCQTDAGSIAVRNSRGLDASFRFSRTSLYLVCEASKGGATAPFASACHAYGISALEPETLGIETSRLAEARSVARRSRPGKAPLVWSPRAAAQLAALSATIASGEAPWGAGGDEALGSQAFTLVDDALLPGGYGSTPFDGEGVATGRHVFVERGVRKARAHTSASAARSGCASTGHALRPDFAFPPRLGFHNLHIAPTPGPPSDLVREAGEGVYLVELSGADEDLSGPVALRGWGFLIRGGELASPVGVEIAEATLGKLLLRLRAAGSDLVTYPGGVAGSTLLMEGVPIR